MSVQREHHINRSNFYYPGSAIYVEDAVEASSGQGVMLQGAPDRERSC